MLAPAWRCSPTPKLVRDDTADKAAAIEGALAEAALPGDADLAEIRSVLEAL